MMTSLTSQKLLVISDIHLGNPFSKCRQEVLSFIRWAAKEKYDICINGDGLEIAQASFTQLAQEMPEVFHVLSDVHQSGAKIYYVVGNHDIALEHLLEDWGSLKVCPFLNVSSGNARIRIEHGHLYDPFFVAFPVAYEFLTRFAGLLLAIHPNLYHLWIAIEKLGQWWKPKSFGIKGEPPAFFFAAKEITRRGFDTVIFGHTHYSGRVDLGDQKTYINCGSWLIEFEYVEIKNGQCLIKKWPSDSR